MRLDELLDGYDRVSSRRLDPVVRRNRERLGILKISHQEQEHNTWDGWDLFCSSSPRILVSCLQLAFHHEPIF